MGGRGLDSLYGKMLRRKKLPENAHAVPAGGSPTTTAPAHFAGVRMHVANAGPYGWQAPQGTVLGCDSGKVTNSIQRLTQAIVA